VIHLEGKEPASLADLAIMLNFLLESLDRTLREVLEAVRMYLSKRTF